MDAALHGADALMAVRQDRPDVVLLDVMMEGLNALEVLARIRALDPAIRIIMVTARRDLALQQQTRAMGAFDYVIKPFTLSHLHQSVVAALAGSDLPPPRPMPSPTA